MRRHCLGRSAAESVHREVTRDAFQRDVSAIFEIEPSRRREVAYDGRNEDLPGAGERVHSSRDIYLQPEEIVVLFDRFSCVNSDSDRQNSLVGPNGFDEGA